MNNNWIKQLSKTYIQLNEVKANIRGEFPFLMRHFFSDEAPSLAADMARDDLWVAAKAALEDEDHFVQNEKYSAMKKALENHITRNTQKEDLPHIVKFKEMDPYYTELTVGQSSDDRTLRRR